MTHETINSRVIIVGAGAVLQEKFTPPVLDRLGPISKRVILDLEAVRLQDKGTLLRGGGILADGTRVPFNLKNISFEERKNIIAVVTTPDHLGVINSLIESGVQRFIVEKPLVNNRGEITQLQAMLNQHPELKVYPLDFYVQKITPLLILTGKIKSDDPRFDWVTTTNDQPVNQELVGGINNLIGDLEGIEVTIFEGGSLGIPDLDKRKWLENDNLRGGMLLDLGTHALAPLIAAGLIPAFGVKVEYANRYVLGENRLSWVRAKSEQVEINADAQLSIEKDARKIACLVKVGKTFHDGGMWKLIIRGSKGDISMGLRTGQRLTVEPKEGESFQLKLKVNDPYAYAFQEAQMYFDGYTGFDGNLQAMLSSIEIIEDIKVASNQII